MRKQFGETMVELAQRDEKIVLLIGDVEQEMKEFIKRFPTRFFNLGLCEQTIISMSAGMAIEGLRPFVYSLTPFLLERPFEQIKIDIDEQNLPVILIGYADYPTHGPTHRPLNARGLISLFKNIDGYFPHTAAETHNVMIKAYLKNKPAVICLQKEGPPIW